MIFYYSHIYQLIVKIVYLSNMKVNNQTTKEKIVQVKKAGLQILKKPCMSLCFFDQSLEIIKYIKEECEKNNKNSDNIYLLGVRYPKKKGGDVQFLVTGHVNKKKNLFVETSNQASRRELMEELGIWVIGEMGMYEYNNTQYTTKNSKTTIMVCKSLCKNTNSSKIQVNLPKIKENYLCNFKGFSRNNNFTKSYFDNLKSFLRTKGFTKKIIKTSKSRNSIYRAYTIPANKCEPMKLRYNLNYTKPKTQKIPPKICSYIYGTQKELETLISKVDLMLDSDDKIQAFAIINLNDIMNWLINYESLSDKPKSIDDYRLKTNFNIKIQNFVKRSLRHNL